MKCERYVIKLGGSLITDKNRPYTIRKDVVAEAASTLSEAHHRDIRLVVIHGGGSFGHYEVEAIEKEKGLLFSSDAPRIQASMLRLAIEIVGSLLARGVPASLHPPHTLCARWPSNCWLQPIIRDVEIGLVPVTYGDALPGGDDNVVIVSGDDLALSIASLLGTGTCLVFAMDKGGVLGEDGRVLPIIRPGSRIARLEGENYDVTGGIERKLAAAFEAARRGITTVITSIEGMRRIIIEGEIPRERGTLVKV